MKLWFENAWGEERIIAEHCNTWYDVHQVIQSFLEGYEKIWPNKAPFQWHYTRIWKQEDGRTRIDVGSHTEFFIWEGETENDSKSSSKDT